MSLINRKADMRPYDMKRRPSKQYPFLMPFIWFASWLMTRQFGLKTEKINMKGIKPPYLVIAAHQGFSDYYIGPLSVFPHRAMFVSDMEGFAAFGDRVYRGLGCIPKRRYVSDASVVRNIKYGLSKGQIVFVYPESRHSNVGTTSYIPDNIGKLAKKMNVPVVTLSVNGSYLANPFWDEEHTRRVPVSAVMECICNADELKNITSDELQKIIVEKLSYDEYRYQQENNIIINYKNRAEGLHKALYQCKKCGAEYDMTSKGSILRCNACNSEWILSENGWLVDSYNVKYHIPDWYEWQRNQIIEEKLRFPYEYDVRVEALPNHHGFVDMGKGRLIFTETEFMLETGNKTLHFPHRTRESVQTEYNYRGRGCCIVLSDTDCCYYIYSDDKSFQPTWFQLAGEMLYAGLNGKIRQCSR